MSDTLTIGEALPSIRRTLNQSDQLCALIPVDLLEWRPVDPSGAFQFSLAEIALHIADSRLIAPRQLEGNNSEEGFMVEYLDVAENGSHWKCKPYAGKAAILEHLKNTRAVFETWLARPASELLSITPEAEAAFKRTLEGMEQRGEDTSVLKKRGAANPMRLLSGAAIHESGHRASLHTLLRQHGINLPEN